MHTLTTVRMPATLRSVPATSACDAGPRAPRQGIHKPVIQRQSEADRRFRRRRIAGSVAGGMPCLHWYIAGVARTTYPHHVRGVEERGVRNLRATPATPGARVIDRRTRVAGSVAGSVVAGMPCLHWYVAGVARGPPFF